MNLLKYRFLELAGSIGLLLCLISFSHARSVLEYELSMPEPNTHYFHVKISMEDLSAPYVDMVMPIWTPGSYLVREFARNVDFFEAFDAQNKDLDVDKINKNTWRIQTRGVKKLLVSYQVYAYELTVRTSYLDLDHAYINGASVFMYPEGRQQFSCSLKIQPYPGWNRISTSLTEESKWSFTAPDYDILVDSPIEIGNHHEFVFEAAGIPHRVAMVGETVYDEERLKTDMAKVVEASTDVFGSNPNESYLFIVHHLDNRGGGLEHFKSTTLQVDRWTYSTKSGYDGFLSLVAHEYFHLWLVKRIRPESLGPFDYSNENYTDLLWIMEGFTSYYDEMLLQRTGLLTEETYLRKLTGSISSVENRPGNLVQPVAEASFDAWIKYYRPDENSFNTTVSYYTKGSVLAAMLDLAIIESSKGERSLDDLLKALYQQYLDNPDRGFNSADFKKLVEKFTGNKMDEFFGKYVNGTEKIDYNRFFGYAGIELIETPRSDIYLGINFKMKEGKLIADQVIRDSPAARAGLNPGDEILALNNFRVDQRKLTELLEFKNPGEKISLLISREGMVRTLEAELSTSPFLIYNLIPKVDPQPDQKAVYEKWLQQEKS